MLFFRFDGDSGGAGLNSKFLTPFAGITLIRFAGIISAAQRQHPGIRGKSTGRNSGWQTGSGNHKVAAAQVAVVQTAEHLKAAVGMHPAQVGTHQEGTAVGIGKVYHTQAAGFPCGRRR